MKNRTVLKRVIAAIGRFKILLAVSLLLSALSVVMTLYIPVLAGNAVDGLSAAGGVDFDAVKKALRV